MSNTVQPQCPKCGAPLSSEAPQGLCPKCLLLQASLATEDGSAAITKTAPPATEELAEAFPHLEIIELIGQGGMGYVFKARQPKLDRFVALKILPQTLAADPAFAERFSREGRVLARLNHPNIVTIHDFGQANGFFYLLMEFVDGVNLRQAMKVGRFTPAQALAVVPKICEALQFAHNEGILHRDIKPENILLDSKGRVKIADFGIAKLVATERSGAGNPLPAENSALAETAPIRLTETGKVLGTPPYMAPEQLERPHDVDQRADVYSLGVVFYEMLTGELPTGRFALPSEKAPVDPRVDEVVLRALEREREKRFHDAGEVKTCVETITSGAGSPASKRSLQTPARTSACYITTPKYLQSILGRFLYQTQGRGELRLEAGRLQFRSGWKEVIIPLRSIRAITHGAYPVAAPPAHVCYFGVTFNEHGKDNTLLFTPVPSGFPQPEQAVRHVLDWESALQEAIRVETGEVVSVMPAIPVSLRWWEVAMTLLWTTLFCGVWFALIPLMLLQRLPRPSELIYAPIVAVGAFILSHLVMRWRMRRSARWADPEGAKVASRAVGPSGTMVLSPRTSSTESSPAVRRRGVSYFSTPDRMRNCFPSAAAHVFQCKGELLLDSEKLTFISPWQTRIEISLKNIDELSIGQFQMWTTPWVMHYARVNFLAVTFARDGAKQTVHLAPVASGTTSAQGVDDEVASWFKVIEQAAAAAKGSIPGISVPGAVMFSAEPAWNRKGLPLFGAWILAVILAVLHERSMFGPLPELLRLGLFAGMGVLLAALGWFCIGFLKANSAISRGNLDAVTSNEPLPLDVGDTHTDDTTTRQDWWTWSPLQSAEVREICSHLTKPERNHVSVLGLLFSLLVLGAVFGIPKLVTSFPRPGNWIVASLLVLLFIVTVAGFQRMLRHFLCSTEWAKERGFKSEDLRLYSFRGGNLWLALAAMALGLIFIWAQNKAVTRSFGLSTAKPTTNQRAGEELPRFR